MKGFRIICTIEEYPDVYRVIDIPEDVSFLDLHTCLQAAFLIPDVQDYFFMVSETRIPVFLEEDKEKRREEESGVSPSILIKAGEPIYCTYITGGPIDRDYAAEGPIDRDYITGGPIDRDNATGGPIDRDNIPGLPIAQDSTIVDPIHHNDTDGEEFTVCIRKKKILSSYPNTYAVVKEAAGVVPCTGSTTSNSGQQNTEQPSLNDINRILEDCPLEMLPDQAPTLEDIAGKNLDHLDKITKDLGIDFQSILEKEDKIFQNSPVLPKRPSIREDERGPLHKNVAEADAFFRTRGASIRISFSDQSIQELLLRADSLGLFDYCKYLQLYDQLDKSDAKKAEAIYNEYRKFPELLLYPLTEEQAEVLVRIARLAESYQLYQGENLSALVLMGLAVFDPEKKELKIARDLPDIISRLTDKKRNETFRLLKNFDQGFTVLIRHYGLIELISLHEKMQEYFHMNLPLKKCNRIVYWHYSLLSLYVTFTDYDNHKSYVMERFLDAEVLARQMFITDLMIPYADISDYELDQWKTNGDYMHVFAGWSYLFGLLLTFGKMNKEEARNTCDRIYAAVRNGADLKDVMYMLNAEHEQNKAMFPRIFLWETCLHFLLGTSLPALKGANRMAVVRNPVYSICPASHFVEKPVSEEDIKKSTHIENMPERLQIEIASRLFTLEETDFLPLRKIQKRFPDNADINYIVGMAYHRMYHPEEALKYYENARRILGGKDGSIDIAIDDVHKGLVRKPISIFEDGTVYL